MYFTCVFLFITCCCCAIEGAKTLTKQEKQALEKFRPLVENELYLPYMDSDTFLLRWIEDREFGLEAAKVKLLKAIKWRKENDIDKIHLEQNPFLDNYLQYDVSSKDSAGGPLVLIDFGKWDVRRVVVAGKRPELNRHMLKMMEHLFSKALELHQTFPEISQNNGFSLRKQGVPFFVEFIFNYENYYTGSSRNIMAVNIPKTFETIGNLVRGAMSPGTRKAFKLYGSDRSEWDYLDKLIPRDELPPRYGGTKK